ncbi:hypothetical protein FisN_18Lh058 [Fistulifera solaris]|uniref:Uncharacterized protein n=1 Tax=Fistulifera solaris TaxID=1519565 RepID=A0A1Z5KE99_FISSO|nr:hypothetical protein FisN_18Lh058 [Fistulifera solaris]|eukprot:GAX24506.1 hypothetical protein FisN_18Lh058 [Fistulifera solaris]
MILPTLLHLWESSTAVQITRTSWPIDDGSNSNHTCLQHPPLRAHTSTLGDLTSTTTNYTILQQPTPRHCGMLQRSWTNVAYLSPIAQELLEWQADCSIPSATFHLDNSFGFGSHLYLFSQALCNAIEMNTRVRTVLVDDAPWLWWDQHHCAQIISDNRHSKSPWDCYFPLAEPSCPISSTSTVNITNPRNPRLRCQRLRNNETAIQEFRAATFEYLFHAVSPLVFEEAKRQIGLLFPNGQAPPDLITVHIRWGDKFWEMDLVPIADYIQAVEQLVASSTDAHIYLATEDPRAAEEFVASAPSYWNIYIDRTLVELTDARPNKGNRASWMTKNTQGRAGLMNVASWLIALEANRFVLTTASNWSRIVNDLRKNVIDPRCGNCTQVIDLRPGLW